MAMNATRARAIMGFLICFLLLNGLWPPRGGRLLQVSSGTLLQSSESVITSHSKIRDSLKLESYGSGPPPHDGAAAGFAQYSECAAEPQHLIASEFPGPPFSPPADYAAAL
jgi:hypothetical protein